MAHVKLIPGERQLGRYTIGIVRQQPSGWQVDLVQLDGVVSNFRLSMRPMHRRYQPACLPRRYIRDVNLTRVGHYRAVMIELTTGDYLYLTVSTGSLEHFHDDLKAMKIPQPKFQFDATVAKRDIERLIQFFGSAP